MNNETNTATTPAQQAQVFKEIEDLRKKIDGCDEKTISNFKERLDLVAQIGEIKRRVKMAICDPKREIKQFARYVILAKQHDISPEEICTIFRMIVYYSKLAQRGLSLEKLRQRRPPGKIPKR